MNMGSTRKRLDPPTESHDRWLVSYADFVTLLFALFVVLFASSQTDGGSVRALSRSVNQAFQGRRVAEVPRETHDHLAEASDALFAALAREIESRQISVAMESRGLVISLRESAFFPSGGDALLPAAVPSMGKIASIIVKLPNHIRLEGHTDARPISNSRFHDNWELSAARGIAVLHSFQHRHGIPAEKMAVVAYADTMPKTSNDSEEGRATNRRVDVTILNDGAWTQAPTRQADGLQRASGKED